MRPIDADAVFPWYLEAFNGKTGPRKIEPNEAIFSMNDIKENMDNIPTLEWGSHWIPTSKKLPEEKGLYLTTTMYGDVYCDYWNGLNFDRTEYVIAWKPMPEPYKGGEEHE